VSYALPVVTSIDYCGWPYNEYDVTTQLVWRGMTDNIVATSKGNLSLAFGQTSSTTRPYRNGNYQLQ
jgi:hypothetical protein